MGLRNISRLPLFPFLVAALPAIHFHETNFRLLKVTDSFRIIFLYWLVTALLLFLGRLLWKDWNRAALVLAPVVTVLFLGNKVGGVLSLIFLVLALFLGVLLLRRPLDVGRASPPLNLATLVLVVLPIIQTVVTARDEVTPVTTPLFAEALDLDLPAGSSPPPDIYFLILDGLGQPDYLAREFHVPPQVLFDALGSRGFHVTRRSFSNYQQTALSLAATLNLALVTDLLDISDPENADRRVLGRLVANSRVLRGLQKVGYDLVTYPSGYPLTRMNDPVRRHTPLIDPTFLEYYVLTDGALPLWQPLVGRGPADLSFALRRQRLEFMFDQLPSAREGIGDDKSVFVFAHIMAPHPPFVFGSQGEALRSRQDFAFADGSHWYNIHGREGTPYASLYSDQLAYVMKRLGEAVDGILAASPRPPVIIVQGDHGPGSKLHHERIMYSDHEERFGVFNAWYLPPGLDLPLEEGGTLLDTFPLLLNALFQANLPSPPDRFFYTRMSAPYAHIELNAAAD